MKASRAYELRAVRSGRTPAWLAGNRVDHVEIVELESGEVVLFWDLGPLEASRLIKALRRDLVSLDAEQFFTAWSDAGR